MFFNIMFVDVFYLKSWSQTSHLRRPLPSQDLPQGAGCANFVENGRDLDGLPGLPARATAPAAQFGSLPGRVSKTEPA